MLTERIDQGLTFDDVLLVPGRSEVHPTEVELTTSLTRHIQLGNFPPLGQVYHLQAQRFKQGPGGGLELIFAQHIKPQPIGRNGGLFAGGGVIDRFYRFGEPSGPKA